MNDQILSISFEFESSQNIGFSIVSTLLAKQIAQLSHAIQNVSHLAWKMCVSTTNPKSESKIAHTACVYVFDRGVNWVFVIDRNLECE